MDYYPPRLPCDATQIGRFRHAIGEDGLQQLLKSSIETALQIKALKPTELERVIVDTTVQEKAIAHPVDRRLLEIARHKVVRAAKRAGLLLKQTFAKEGKQLRRQAGGYAHAKQFRRLKKGVKRQRTILGVVMREAQRKRDALRQVALSTPAANSCASSLASSPAKPPASATALSDLPMWLARAERIRTQQRHDKGKLYALHAPEVECIGKSKARKPYEFGVKVSLAVTHKQGLMGGAQSFPGNPYDGHTLAVQLQQRNDLLSNLARKPVQGVVDRGFRGVDADHPNVQIIHRGTYKTLTSLQKRWLRHRQAIAPRIGHAKSDHRMNRCWLAGAQGDALHALSCAAGYNIRWLLRAIARLDLRAVFLRLHSLTAVAQRGACAGAAQPWVALARFTSVLRLRFSATSVGANSVPWN